MGKVKKVIYGRQLKHPNGSYWICGGGEHHHMDRGADYCDCSGCMGAGGVHHRPYPREKWEQIRVVDVYVEGQGKMGFYVSGNKRGLCLSQIQTTRGTSCDEILRSITSAGWDEIERQLRKLNPSRSVWDIIPEQRPSDEELDGSLETMRFRTIT